MPAEGCDVDAGGERRVLFEDAAMERCCGFPSLPEEFCHAPVGCQPFIRRCPHMMGFGHVPTGSIRNNGHTGVGGPRRTSSTHRSVTET